MGPDPRHGRHRADARTGARRRDSRAHLHRARFLGRKPWLGFATLVYADPRAAAFETAREIAGRSPSAVEAAKRVYNKLPQLSVAEALLQESVEQDALKGGHNQASRWRRGATKRAPVFVNAR